MSCTCAFSRTKAKYRPGEQSLLERCPQRELTGTLVNAVERRGNRVQVTVEDTRDLRPGIEIYRNRDHAFLRQVEQSRPTRR